MTWNRSWILCIAVGCGLGANRAARAELILSIEGECPGTMTLRWEGAEPNRTAGLAYSPGLGEFWVPLGICGGTLLNLDSRVFLVGTGRTGPDGQGAMEGFVPGGACGGYLQMIVVDFNPCTTSNVVQIPE